jgi:RND family efflux transporter MFP subunit
MRKTATAGALAALSVLLTMVPAAAQEVVRGSTRPKALVSLAPQVDGIVRRLAVAEGDRVTRGEILLQLKDDVQQARIALARASAGAEADLRKARIELEEAVAVLQRTEAAAGRGAARDWELRQAKARVDLARAGVDSAAEKRTIEARRLELEQAAAEQHVIRAPFDGVVTRVDVVVGATIDRGDKPLTVADLSILEAELFLPGRLWPLLRPGNAYPLAIAEPAARDVEGVLRTVDPVMDAASGRFRAVFTIANGELQLPAGLEATLDLSRIPVP